MDGIKRTEILQNSGNLLNTILGGVQDKHRTIGRGPCQKFLIILDAGINKKELPTLIDLGKAVTLNDLEPWVDGIAVILKRGGIFRPIVGLVKLSIVQIAPEKPGPIQHDTWFKGQKGEVMCMRDRSWFVTIPLLKRTQNRIHQPLNHLYTSLQKEQVFCVNACVFSCVSLVINT